MAAEVLMQEEIHNSMATSDEDAEFEEDDELGTPMMEEQEAAHAANIQLQNGMVDHNQDDEIEGEDEGDAELSDEDAEGEDDDEVIMAEEEEEDDDEDAEGVGAVKIQPGLEDDEEDAMSGTDEADEDEEFAASASADDDEKDSSDPEGEMEWEAEAAEEEEDAANPNRCIFCHQDEENDPGVEFEMYLSCDVCADNSHRQCAREADALQIGDEAETWRCPSCTSNRLQPEGNSGATETAESLRDLDPRRIPTTRMAGDLLPAQRGAIKPDSHSVFNTLIAPEDPLDGSRFLRRRKTSSADAEMDESTMTRKRNRDREIISSTRSSDAHIAQKQDEEAEKRGIKGETLTNGNGKIEEIISPRASRSLRPKPTQASASIAERVIGKKIRLIFRIDPVELRHVESQPPKPKKKKKSSRPTAPTQTSSAPPTLINPNYSQPFYALHDKEPDESKSKPYGGVLKDAEAETTNTLPKADNRRQFDEARQKSEEEWQADAAAAAEAALAAGARKPRKVSGPASSIEYIEFGPFQIDIWYASPYPEEYSRNKALFVCEFCLKYMESPTVAWRHKSKCPWKHPPGDEIYREGKIAMYEVDGRKNPLYCQNLCLLAKLFLGSKTLYYDVEPFLFYVMTEIDDKGYHFVGYFSKEKRASSLNNVSCILVLPIHQRKGYGHLLIDFSYLLTRHEKKTGSPEKPLSDMGLVSYRNYWRLIMSTYLRRFRKGDPIPSIKTISEETGMTADDVVSALESLGVIIRDPETGTYAIKLNIRYFDEVVRQHEAKARNYAKLNPKSLTWTPFVMGRGNASHFELAPPLSTVAPREEEDEIAIHAALSTSTKRDFATFSETKNDMDSLGKMAAKTGELTISDSSSKSGSTFGSSTRVDYFEAATSAKIPATRFEIFPVPPGTKKSTAARLSMSRQRSYLGASTPAANKSPRPSSSRRSTASRPSTRRKSTGRGPGRWPKGSKKTDFPNPDSGPGLPPKLEKKRSRLGQEVVLGDEENEDAIEDGDAEDDEDAILYETPAQRKRSHRSTATSRGLGKPSLGKPGGMGKPGGKTLLVEPEEDAEMEDTEYVMGDIDAEGEDE